MLMKADISRLAPWKDSLASSILLFMLGIILIVMRSGAISMVIIFIGAIMMVYGSNTLSRGIRGDNGSEKVLGALACILGLLLVLASGVFLVLMIYVLAAFMAVFGVIKILDDTKSKKKRGTNLLIGLALIAIALVLIVVPGATADLAMMRIGLVLVVMSSLSIWTAVR